MKALIFTEAFFLNILVTRRAELVAMLDKIVESDFIPIVLARHIDQFFRILDEKEVGIKKLITLPQPGCILAGYRFAPPDEIKGVSVVVLQEALETAKIKPSEAALVSDYLPHWLITKPMGMGLILFVPDNGNNVIGRKYRAINNLSLLPI